MPLFRQCSLTEYQEPGLEVQEKQKKGEKRKKKKEGRRKKEERERGKKRKGVERKDYFICLIDTRGVSL